MIDEDDLSLQRQSSLDEDDNQIRNRILYFVVGTLLISFFSLPILNILGVPGPSDSPGLLPYVAVIGIVGVFVLVFTFSASRPAIVVSNRFLLAGFFGVTFLYIVTYDLHAGAYLQFYAQMAFESSPAVFWGGTLSGMLFLAAYDFGEIVSGSYITSEPQSVPFLRLTALVISTEIALRPIVNTVVQSSDLAAGQVTTGVVVFALTAGTVTISAIHWGRSGLNRAVAYASIGCLAGMSVASWSGYSVGPEILTSALPLFPFFIGYTIALGLLFVLDWTVFLRDEGAGNVNSDQ